MRQFLNSITRKGIRKSSLKRFVLLFQGRTGSTYITDRVNGHPHVSMEPEVWGGWGFQLKPEEIQKHIAKQQAWLKSFYEKPYPTSMRSIGFKTKLDDVLDKRDFISYLRKNNIHIIHLTRNNIIKLVISEINAQRLFEKASTWNLENERDRLETFTLDIERFHEQLKWRLQVEQWLESYINILNLPTIKLFYEDMLKDENMFFSELYRFIGVKPIDTKGSTLKNTPNDLRKVIDNYDDLLSRYKYTVYEPMIYET